MSVQPYKHVVVVPQRRRTNGPAGAATAAADTTRILRNGNGIYIRKSRKSLLNHPADESAQMLKIHDQGRTRAPRAGYGAPTRNWATCSFALSSIAAWRG